ncbi:MAG TPA: hypothetical protein VEC57_20805 [Candidatus Limnocylindrales bacterium]|nr:hypothetical protein [Candidatus Limnocylindrales bacterium]
MIPAHILLTNFAVRQCFNEDHDSGFAVHQKDARTGKWMKCSKWFPTPQEAQEDFARLAAPEEA